MSRVLLIGASGQLGAAVAARLGPQQISLPRAEFDLATLTDQAAAAVIEAHRPDTVLCVAGATDVERCEREPEWADAVNCRGPVALAHAAADRPFVYLSTDYVFDGVNGPYEESEPTNPLSAYGRSKREAEQALLAEYPAALILRTTGLFGFDSRGKNFLYTLRRVLAGGGVMRVATDQISNPTYTEDLAEALLELVSRRATGLFHAAGPELISRYDFAMRAAEILGLDTAKLQGVRTSELGQVAARPLRSGLDTEKLEASLGRNPFRPLDEAIADFAVRAGALT